MKIEGISGFVHEVSCGTNHTLVLADSGKGDVLSIEYRTIASA